jgi:hypothetical protein
MVKKTIRNYTMLRAKGKSRFQKKDETRRVSKNAFPKKK